MISGNLVVDKEGLSRFDQIVEQSLCAFEQQFDNECKCDEIKTELLTPVKEVKFLKSEIVALANWIKITAERINTGKISLALKELWNEHDENLLAESHPNNEGEDVSSYVSKRIKRNDPSSAFVVLLFGLLLLFFAPLISKLLPLIVLAIIAGVILGLTGGGRHLR